MEILGIGTLFYGLATVAEFSVSGQLTGLLGERRTQRMIDSYSDHGGLDSQPDPGSVVSSGDVLIAIGAPAALERLETVFQPASVRGA